MTGHLLTPSLGLATRIDQVGEVTTVERQSKPPVMTIRTAA
jgi:hypothetical protein